MRFPMLVERRTRPSPEHRRDCPNEVFNQAVAVATKRMSAVYDTDGEWLDRVRAAVLELLELLEEDRELARLCVTHAVLSHAKLIRPGAVLGELIRVIDHGRTASRAVPNLPSPAAEGVLGGALGLIYGELIARDPGRLVELLNPLMFWIALPYLGVSAACEERHRPAPAGRSTCE